MKRCDDRNPPRGIAIWRMLAVVLLAAGIACAETPATTGPVREPEIRQIDSGRDASALARIEQVRRKLPEKYQHRNNFAWAVAKIERLGKTEYFAHSGIQDLRDFSGEAGKQLQDISLRCRKGRFTVLCVNHDDVVEGADCWPRYVDTEYKILEDLAAHLPDSAAAGQVRLYTDLYPCASCRNVMKQFLAVYTNVQMQILYRER